MVGRKTNLKKTTTFCPNYPDQFYIECFKILHSKIIFLIYSMEYLSKYLQRFFASSQTSRMKTILMIFEIMWQLSRNPDWIIDRARIYLGKEFARLVKNLISFSIARLLGGNKNKNGGKERRALDERERKSTILWKIIFTSTPAREQSGKSGFEGDLKFEERINAAPLRNAQKFLWKSIMPSWIRTRKWHRSHRTVPVFRKPI